MDYSIRAPCNIWHTAQIKFIFKISIKSIYIYNESNHFQGIYPVIIWDSFVFHIVYGALMGFISGRMAELRVFAKLKATAANNSLQYLYWISYGQHMLWSYWIL